MSDKHRYARQLLISEVGPRGQEQIASCHFREESGLRSSVAADYLRRAGARADPDGSTLIPLSIAEHHGKTRIALDTLAGTLGALEAIRRAVGLAPAQPLEP